MTWFPSSETFAALAADPRFPFALGIAALSGIVRGFSGFGSAMIYVPLMAAIYSPREAATTLVLMDFVSALIPALQVRKQANWSDVVPILIASVVCVPLGTMILLAADQAILRWIISIGILGLLAVLITGWRYRGPTSLPLKIGIGAVSGVGSGAANAGGPPVIVYWLSTAAPAAMRANLLVYFQFNGAAMIASFALQGVFDRNNIALALIVGPTFGIALAIGSRFFRGASDTLYRNVAYAIVAVAAFIGVPVFDGILR
ncbi:MAG TPA: sulfite exporter TauE/SafE family protein [Xanthobacteraceae bacterium]|nr:sulfite exporter TauE/SafE family protein [Xanthobacteraceae bacterium]